MDYTLLSNDNGDIQRKISSDIQKDKNWVITNYLPLDLYIYIEKFCRNKPLHFLSVIKAKDTIIVNKDKLSGKDILRTYILNNSKFYQIMDKHIIKNFAKEIKLGDVGYHSLGGNSEFQAAHTDMNGIYLRNRLSIPITVYYKGNRVAELGPYIGLSFLGGGNSDIFFDNDRSGIDFGDVLTFKYNDKLLYNIKIIDEQAQDLHIGIIRGNFNPRDPDNSIYRVNKDVYSGVTFFEKTCGYKTKPTNPSVPLY